MKAAYLTEKMKLLCVTTERFLFHPKDRFWLKWNTAVYAVPMFISTRREK